jgi:hypothetical protein
MTLYSCNRINGKIRICKFEDNSNPESVYDLEELRSGKFICECMGFNRHSHCKHIDIYHKFRYEGKLDTGNILDPETGEFTEFLGAKSSLIDYVESFDENS